MERENARFPQLRRLDGAMSAQTKISRRVALICAFAGRLEDKEPGGYLARQIYRDAARHTSIGDDLAQELRDRYLDKHAEELERELPRPFLSVVE